jgi:FkbM family methyltransferase
MIYKGKVYSFCTVCACKAGARAIATEPEVESSPLLMGNIRRNNCENKVITLNIVTGNENGLLKLYQPGSINTGLISLIRQGINRRVVRIKPLDKMLHDFPHTL